MPPGINLSSVFVQNRFQWCGCNVEQFYLHRARSTELYGVKSDSTPSPTPIQTPSPTSTIDA